ncbi:hypothetical protein GCM10010466_12100 [Planomonospora alba]|uniref:DUF305 domain-containing protein n=1 Tax=Planomonospora alba TaxID=161354 RepID=A0ABP6MQU3_9ACTN
MRRPTFALAVASLLLLPACGTASTSHGDHAAAPHDGHAARPPDAGQAAAATGSPASPGEAGGSEGFNDADVMFLQMMIPHHRQGVQMAALAGARSTRGTVKALAAAVEATQRDEITAMTRRLKEWGRPLTAPPGAHDAHGGLHTTSPREIAELGAARGADFDVKFLNMLIGHQHNAVDMARTEVRTGRHPEVVELARRIDRSRSAQITAMLAELGS